MWAAGLDFSDISWVRGRLLSNFERLINSSKQMWSSRPMALAITVIISWWRNSNFIQESHCLEIIFLTKLIHLSLSLLPRQDQLFLLYFRSKQHIPVKSHLSHVFHYRHPGFMFKSIRKKNSFTFACMYKLATIFWTWLFSGSSYITASCWFLKNLSISEGCSIWHFLQRYSWSCNFISLKLWVSKLAQTKLTLIQLAYKCISRA